MANLQMATLAALTHAAANPGTVVVCTPLDEVVVVVGNAGLRVVRADLRRLVARVIYECEPAGRANAAHGGLGRVLTSEAETIWRRSSDAGVARKTFVFTSDTRPFITAAIIEPIVERLCRRWPSVEIDDFNDGIEAWLRLWSGAPTGDRYRELCDTIERLVPFCVLRRIDGHWVEGPVPQMSAKMIPVPDMQTAMANLDLLPDGVVQYIEDPKGKTRWMCQLSNNNRQVLLLLDEPLRSTMRDFILKVADDDLEATMLTSCNPTRLRTLDAQIVSVITPAAIASLTNAVQCGDDLVRAMVDISLSTMVGLIVRAAGECSQSGCIRSSALEAARRHMYAWLSLLPTRAGLTYSRLDAHLNKMVGVCDLELLQEWQATMQSMRVEMQSQRDLNVSTARLIAHLRGSTAAIDDFSAEHPGAEPSSAHYKSMIALPYGHAVIDAPQGCVFAPVPSYVPSRAARQIVEDRLEIGLPASFKMSGASVHALFETHPDHGWRHNRTRSECLRAMHVQKARTKHGAWWLGVRPCGDPSVPVLSAVPTVCIPSAVADSDEEVVAAQTAEPALSAAADSDEEVVAAQTAEPAPSRVNHSHEEIRFVAYLIDQLGMPMTLESLMSVIRNGDVHDECDAILNVGGVDVAIEWDDGHWHTEKRVPKDEEKTMRVLTAYADLRMLRIRVNDAPPLDIYPRERCVVVHVASPHPGRALVTVCGALATLVSGFVSAAHARKRSICDQVAAELSGLICERRARQYSQRAQQYSQCANKSAAAERE